MRTNQIIILLALAISFASATSVALSTQVPAIPSSIPGYSTYDKSKVKKISLLLNAFINLSPAFVISAVNAAALPASSYSVIFRSSYANPFTSSHFSFKSYFLINNKSRVGRISLVYAKNYKILYSQLFVSKFI